MQRKQRTVIRTVNYCVMVISPNRGPCFTGYKAKHAEILTESNFTHHRECVYCGADVQSVQVKGSQACKREDLFIYLFF